MATTKPTDLYTVNGFYLEIPGLVAPHFETLDGISKEGSTVNIVDAGSNVEMSFSGGLLKLGGLSLGRTEQGTPDDAVLAKYVEDCILRGLKFPVITLVKKHNQVEVYRLMLEGFRFVSRKEPAYDINSGEKMLVQYTATIDDSTKI